MATEFYKSIPESIKGKLEEYCIYEPIEESECLSELFAWSYTPEGYDFWNNHCINNTFPQWSDELNRFIDPPTINTITVNADEYQAMRDWVVNEMKSNYNRYSMYKSKASIEVMEVIAKRIGIDINEITN
jgi:uncharacterized membrane protein